MANPNSASDRDFRKNLNADNAEAAAKAAAAAAAGPRVGTAADPIKGSANLGSVPSTHNIKAQWVDQVRDLANKVSARGEGTLKAWHKLGLKLAEIKATFIKLGLDGKPIKGKDGKPVANNNAYNDWLIGAGLAEGVLSNPNTRTACIWLAGNWSKVEKLPAALRHGHPIHARQAVTDFENAMLTAKAAYKGEGKFNEAQFAEEFIQPAKERTANTTAPHTFDTCMIALQRQIKGGTDLLDIVPAAANEWKAWAELLKAEVFELRVALKDAKTLGEFNAAAPETKSKPKTGNPRKPKAKTEFGDERSDVEASEYATGDEPVVMAPLQLPAPAADLAADLADDGTDIASFDEVKADEPAASDETTKTDDEANINI